MKKLAFLFVAVSAISFASCGNKTEAPVEETDTVAADTVECCDSACCDTVAADTVVAE